MTLVCVSFVSFFLPFTKKVISFKNRLYSSHIKSFCIFVNQSVLKDVKACPEANLQKIL